mgnify:CR=1 FL=1
MLEKKLDLYYFCKLFELNEGMLDQGSYRVLYMHLRKFKVQRKSKTIVLNMFDTRSS